MVHHVINKSIAEFVIFNGANEYMRMLSAIRYYQIEKQQMSLSRIIMARKSKKTSVNTQLIVSDKNRNLVDIIAYCIMPTHLHLILNGLKDMGISIFMNNVLNSYTRYFNIKHHRKGPLWEGPSKKVEIKSDDQFLHITRYVHLNPVTAYLVDKPEDWPYSSYGEYISEINEKNRTCNYKALLDVEPNLYKEFVEKEIAYSRELAEIKRKLTRFNRGG